MRLSPRVLCGLSPSEFAATTVRPSVQSTVVRVLEYLEAHVFEPELTVERVLSDCGVRDHNFTAYFHLVTGLGLYQLIEKERMRGAKALLVETNWPIWRIAFTVGYSSPVSFLERFDELLDTRQRPGVHRTAVRGREAARENVKGNRELMSYQPKYPAADL